MKLHTLFRTNFPFWIVACLKYECIQLVKSTLPSHKTAFCFLFNVLFLHRLLHVLIISIFFLKKSFKTLFPTFFVGKNVNDCSKNPPCCIPNTVANEKSIHWRCKNFSVSTWKSENLFLLFFSIWKMYTLGGPEGFTFLLNFFCSFCFFCCFCVI